MKKFGIFLFAFILSASIQAQKNILNHMDLGVNVGTVGIGVDVAVPVGDYVRIRAGYNYMPRFTFHSNFPIETSTGGSIKYYIEKINSIDIDKKVEELGIDIDQPEFQVYKDALNQFRDVEPRDYVSMGIRPNLHQFKFMVDVMPFKNNKHWSITAGFFAGPSNVGDACNMEEETKLLQAVNAYNMFYIDYLSNGRNFAGHGEVEQFTRLYTTNGIAGFPIGYFEDGDKAMMVPSKDGTARADLEVNKVRPYFGFGYNTHLSRNKKWKLTVDAGVMILGKRRVYVNNVYKINTSLIDPSNECYDIIRPNADETDYDVDEPLPYAVDLMNDLHDIPSGKVRDMVNTISKFKVYPNVSLSVSYRLY
jgi:hypothetical protein